MPGIEENRSDGRTGVGARLGSPLAARCHHHHRVDGNCMSQFLRPFQTSEISEHV